LEPAGSAATIPVMEASTAPRLGRDVSFGTLVLWVAALVVGLAGALA
jgi:hypothetical protein